MCLPTVSSVVYLPKLNSTPRLSINVVVLFVFLILGMHQVCMPLFIFFCGLEIGLNCVMRDIFIKCACQKQKFRRCACQPRYWLPRFNVVWPPPPPLPQPPSSK
jgi:hypothetical protein